MPMRAIWPGQGSEREGAGLEQQAPDVPRAGWREVGAIEEDDVLVGSDDVANVWTRADLAHDVDDGEPLHRRQPGVRRPGDRVLL